MKYQQKEALVRQIICSLQQYHDKQTPLLGIQPVGAINSLARQIVDSIRRVDYIYVVASRPTYLAPSQLNSGAFNPIRAAVWHKNNNNFDEACWLAFLSVCFGKNKLSKWSLIEEIYGAFSDRPVWTWEKIRAEPNALTAWLAQNHMNLLGKFGNHRKYETVNISRNKHVGETVSSYVEWVNQFGGHKNLFGDAFLQASNDPELAFSSLFCDMDTVIRFGRTAKFDYLTMLSKLGLCNLEPDKAYISNATGPKKGIRLLVLGKTDASMSSVEAEHHIKEIGELLPISRMVMQVMEDAICNWQKSQEKYKRFAG